MYSFINSCVPQIFSSVQSLRCVQLFETPWTETRQASLSITNSRSLLRHVHQVSDAIKPSHPLSYPSPPAFSLSHHQDLFQSVGSSHQMAKLLEFQLQHQSFHQDSGLIFLGWTGWISVKSKGFSRDFSNNTVQKHQFFSAQLSFGKGDGTTLQCSCLEKSHGQRSLAGCSPWGHQESDTTERLHFHFSLSCIGGGNGNPLQCSCLENPRDSGAWWAAVYGVAQSQTRLKRLSSSSSSFLYSL